MRSTKNNVEAEHCMQHLAREGVLATRHFSTVTTCTSVMIQDFRVPQYTNYCLTQNLSYPFYSIQ